MGSKEITNDDIIKADCVLQGIAKKDGEKYLKWGLDESFFNLLAGKALKKAVETYNPNHPNPLSFKNYAVNSYRDIRNNKLRTKISWEKQGFLTRIDSIHEPKPGANDEDIILEEKLTDESESQEELHFRKQILEFMYLCINKLEERERMIILMSYGISGQIAQTQEKLAKLFNCSGSNISQIIGKAKSKLKVCLTKTAGFKEVDLWK